MNVIWVLIVVLGQSPETRDSHPTFTTTVIRMPDLATCRAIQDANGKYNSHMECVQIDNGQDPK